MRTLQTVFQRYKEILISVTIFFALIAIAFRIHVVDKPRRLLNQIGAVSEWQNPKDARNVIESKQGKMFSDDQLRIISELVSEFPKPMVLVLSGNEITDPGVLALKGTRNIEAIVLSDTLLSNDVLDTFQTIPELKRLEIARCPNLNKTAVWNFQLRNPSIHVKFE